MLQPWNWLNSENVKFKLSSVKQEVFDRIKFIVEKYLLLVYIEFNKFFDILKDASEHQLGAVIIKWGKMIYLHIKKYTGPKTRYTAPEN